MIGWIEKEDGREEKWHFKTEKQQIEPNVADQSVLSLDGGEKMIQILATNDLQEKIICVLQSNGLENYIVHDEEVPIANIQLQDEEFENRLVFMVAVKAEAYSKLKADLNQSLTKAEQENISCSEALFQIRLED